MKQSPSPPGQTQDDEAVELAEDEAAPLLREGEILGGQRIPWSSNYTFLVRIDAGPGKFLRAVYKPRDGEAPLYDFPDGSLYKREYATFLLSRALGWPPVPLTLVRDGPYGVGSMQLYVDTDPRVTYFDLIADNMDQLWRFMAFDLLSNNADRKGGHCLLGGDGTIWSIDHGLTFHQDFKLRTVMLEFWGEPIPPEIVADLKAFADRLSADQELTKGLVEMLSEVEVDQLTERLGAILEDPTVPQLDPRRNVPWPLE
jgi:uncharacterized repeat protein (TIGR03843 family)